LANVTFTIHDIHPAVVTPAYQVTNSPFSSPTKLDGFPLSLSRVLSCEGLGIRTPEPLLVY